MGMLRKPKIEHVESVHVKISHYIPTIIILGTIGGVLNQVLFFSPRPLRSSLCFLYFRALSFSNLLVLYINILPQWLGEPFGIDPTVEYN